MDIERETVDPFMHPSSHQWTFLITNGCINLWMSNNINWRGNKKKRMNGFLVFRVCCVSILIFFIVYWNAHMFCLSMFCFDFGDRRVAESAGWKPAGWWLGEWMDDWTDALMGSLFFALVRLTTFLPFFTLLYWNIFFVACAVLVYVVSGWSGCQPAGSGQQS